MKIVKITRGFPFQFANGLAIWGLLATQERVSILVWAPLGQPLGQHVAILASDSVGGQFWTPF